jgi:uncharacterized protein with FMN-binding domain
MRKLLLSTALILASTAYVAFGAGRWSASLPSIGELSRFTAAADQADANTALLAPAVAAQAGRAPEASPIPSLPSTPGPGVAPVAAMSHGQLATVTAPVTLASAAPSSLTPTLAGGVQFKDGTYTGTPADAYYGNVQVRAVISSGKLVSVAVLDYPADRSRSRAINSYALPQLATEVVRAQSASVNIVSGATLTSKAYMRSVASALAQAKA